MKLPKKLFGMFAGVCAAAFLTNACMQTPAATAPAVESQGDKNSPLVASDVMDFLKQWLGNLLDNRAISVYVDSTTGDSSYVFTWKMDKTLEAKGGHPVSFAFKKRVVEKVRARYARYDSVTAASANLGKRAQTRWSVSPFDVKALTEVHQIKVYFEISGGAKMKPNWSAAAREAMNRWNTTSGSQVSFVEVTSATDADLRLRCALLTDGSGVTAWLTPDPWVEKDSVEIVYNLGYESTIPASQKLSYAMGAFGLALNITPTGTEGGTWQGGGVFINIPGTPTSDPNSILNPYVSPTSPTTFSTWDLKAIQQMYPAWAGLGKTYNNELIGTGWEGPTTIATNVNTFQYEGDTLYFLKNDGTLWRRYRTTGTNTQIWPTGSFTGVLSSFAVSQGYIAVQKASDGKLFTRRPTATTWTLQTGPAGSGVASQYRIAGERLEVYYPALNSIYARWTVANPTFWSLDWTTTNMQDFQVSGQRLAVVENGSLYAMDSYEGWHLLWNSADGWIQKVSLSADRIVAFRSVSGHWDSYIKDGMYGSWYQFGSMRDLDDADVCGDKFAVINLDGNMYTQDGGLGTYYLMYQIAPAWPQAVRLNGPMCDYVSIIEGGGQIATKYSTSMVPDGFLYYGSNMSNLQQR